jgi:hypothetical protein
MEALWASHSTTPTLEFVKTMQDSFLISNLEIDEYYQIDAQRKRLEDVVVLN